jgi:UDPglucose 6-dehydrogenase
VTKPVIGFAGLTHLGLCSMAAATSKGFDVVGWHDDEAYIARIAEGDLPVSEPDLDRLFADHADRIAVTSDVARLGAADIVYLAIDVPTDDAGESDLAPIKTAIDTVTPALNDTAILVVLCQVPPGFTRGRALDNARLYYQVETLIFGRAVERAISPERFIIGCADPGTPLPNAYRTFLESFDCPVLPMRYESAELAKIAINCFLVASVSTTNSLAELCEAIGADWSEIAPALRLDARIGPHAYLKPGLGIAGGNLERDLTTVRGMIHREGGHDGVISSYIDNSAYMKEWTRRVYRKVVGRDDATVGVLGLAYKQDTHSTKNSPSLAFLRGLKADRIRVHDPLVPATAAPGADGAASALDVAMEADAVLILTPWREYGEIDPRALAERMAGRVLIDPYNMLKTPNVAAAGLDHYVLGRPVEEGN